MASIKPVVPALLVTAAFSENLSLINWGMEQMMRYLGPIALESEPFDFNQTSYYSKEMGPHLFKKLFAFADLVDPSKLADIKNMTNEIESTSHSTSLSEQPRPLNLDPGLLNLGKFMLATTKIRHIASILKMESLLKSHCIFRIKSLSNGLGLTRIIAPSM